MTEFHPKPFGKYFLIEKLATGGMAEIYKAKTFGVDGFEKLLAIKRILPHCSADSEFIHMLIDEAKLSVLLSHTNIVQVYDLGKVGDDYFISMEFINGCNLRELLSRLKTANEKLSEELVIYIISEVCKGLDYAHSKKDTEEKDLNIVHRDISPQNILLSFEGEVKIVDFGIAKAAMNISHTMAGILKGKISYMSPEQALGKPIDRKTDIFSTGLMLHELLTGEKFFTGETQFEVLKKIRTTRITEESFPDTISHSVKKILAKSLSYTTRDRYDTAGDFQIDLTRYLYSTYADFTPRKLAKLVKQVFAEDIESKKARQGEEPALDAQTQSVLVGAATKKKQESIVHREGEAEQTFGGEKQQTQTFMESFLKGEEELEEEMEITGTQAALEEMPTPTPPPSAPPKPVEAKAKRVPQAAVTPKKKLSKKFLWYPMAALVLLGVGYYSYFKTDLFKSAPPEAVVTGILNVRSNPVGAKIFVNDQDTMKITPARLEGLEIEQPLKITLKKEKFKDFSQTLTLADAAPQELNPSLEVIPVGSINVVTVPPGAKIFVDGADTGKVTPISLADLPLNQTYALKLELEKHRPIEEKVTLYSIEPVELKKELQEVKYGTLRIASNPPGAFVFVDNQNSGFKTPVLLPEMEVGKRVIIGLAKPGFRDVTRAVEITEPKELALQETLAKIEEKPPEQTAQEKLAEAEKKRKELEAQQLKQKTQAQEAEKQRQAQQEKTPTLPPKEEVKKPPELPPEAVKKVAFVSVSSTPSGADVSVNGVRKGSAPGKFQVASGSPVRVTVSKSGSAPVTRVVTLKPGETRNLGTIALKGIEAPEPKEPSIKEVEKEKEKAKEKEKEIVSKPPEAPTTLGEGVGVIVIDSNPSGATVLVNGGDQQRTPARIRGLRKGIGYTFTVKMDGYRTWSRYVTVGEGSQSFMANLKKQ